LTKSDQHPIKPPENIGRIVNLGLEDCDSGHEDSGSFLIEGLGDCGMTTFVERTSESSDSQTILAGCVLIVGDELDQTRLVRL
jgi:hypothetical protein